MNQSTAPAEELQAATPLVIKSHTFATSFAKVTLTNGIEKGSLRMLDEMPTAIVRVQDANRVELLLHIFAEPGTAAIDEVDSDYATETLATQLFDNVVAMDFFGTGTMQYEDPVPKRWKTDKGDIRGGWELLSPEEQAAELKADWIGDVGTSLAETVVESLTQAPPVEEQGKVQVFYSHDNDKVGNEVARLDFITRRGHLKASIFIGDKPPAENLSAKLGMAKMLAKAIGIAIPPEFEGDDVEMKNGCFCGKCNAGELKVPFKTNSFDMTAVFKMPFPGAADWFPAGFLEKEVKQSLSVSLEKLTGFYADFIFN